MTKAARTAAASMRAATLVVALVAAIAACGGPSTPAPASAIAASSSPSGASPTASGSTAPATGAGALPTPGAPASASAPTAPTPAAPTPALPPGALLFSVPGAGATGPASELVVADAEGRELRRIALPGTPLDLYPVDASQTALVRSTAGWLVVHADGTVVPIPGITATDASLVAIGRSHAVIGRGSGAPMWIVSLATGVAADMAAAPVSRLLRITLSPDESTVLAYNGTEWLIPTADPSGAKRVGAGPNTATADHAPDASLIVYVVLTDGRSVSTIYVANADGSDPRPVARQSDRVAQVKFGRSAGEVIAFGNKAVSSIDVATGTVTTLRSLSAGSRMISAHVAADGTHALDAVQVGDATPAWTVTDLARQSSRSIAGVDGYGVIGSGPPGPFVLMTQSLDPTRPSRFAVVDLAAGVAKPLAEIPGGTSYAGSDLGEPGPTGFAILRTTKGRTTAQAWLVDGPHGTATLLEEGDAASAVLSPEGTTVAGTRLTGGAPVLDLWDVATATKREIGPAFAVTWLRP